MAELRNEHVRGRKEAFFEYLKAFLIGDSAKVPYRDVADEFGMTEGAVDLAGRRLRGRRRELLRQEIAETVATPEDVENELRDLLAGIGARWGCHVTFFGYCFRGYYGSHSEANCGRRRRGGPRLATNTISDSFR